MTEFGMTFKVTIEVTRHASGRDTVEKYEFSEPAAWCARGINDSWPLTFAINKALAAMGFDQTTQVLLPLHPSSEHWRPR